MWGKNWNKIKLKRKQLLQRINSETLNEVELKNVFIMESNTKLENIHSILIDQETSRSQFVYQCQRLCRLLINYLLNMTPFKVILKYKINLKGWDL